MKKTIDQAKSLWLYVIISISPPWSSRRSFDLIKVILGPEEEALSLPWIILIQEIWTEAIALEGYFLSKEEGLQFDNIGVLPNITIVNSKKSPLDASYYQGLSL